MVDILQHLLASLQAAAARPEEEASMALPSRQVQAGILAACASSMAEVSKKVNGLEIVQDSYQSLIGCIKVASKLSGVLRSIACAVQLARCWSYTG